MKKYFRQVCILRYTTAQFQHECTLETEQKKNNNQPTDKKQNNKRTRKKKKRKKERK